MTRWGIGPKLLLWGLAAAILSLTLSWKWSPFFEYPLLPAGARRVAVVALITGGLIFWISAVAMVMKAFSEGRLCTTGPFALCVSLPIPEIPLFNCLKKTAGHIIID